MDKSKQQRYRENNPKNVEFSQLKQNVKRQNLKETDPEKADLVREVNRKRKAAERARKKATKENIDPIDSESSDVSVLFVSVSVSDVSSGCFSILLHNHIEGIDTLHFRVLTEYVF